MCACLVRGLSKSEPDDKCDARQGVAAHSRVKQERHLHGAVPLAIAAITMAALALLLTPLPWLAFCCMVLSLSSLEAIQGPAWSWPAVWLPQEEAVMGMQAAGMITWQLD